MKGKKKSEIMLVDKREYHTLLPSLPEIISKRGFSIIYYRDILKDRNIEFIQADIKDISLDRKTALIVNNSAVSSTLQYDILVLALGSRPFVPDIQGMNEFALPFNSIEDAQKIAAALQNIEPGSTIVIGGGGATGVELAGEIATLKRTDLEPKPKEVALISTNLLDGFPIEAVKWAKIYLDSLNVELLIG